MIRTGQSRVPWHSVILLCCVSGVAHLIESGVGGVPMGLLLTRYTTNPIAITWIGIIAPTLAILISPYVSWKSDRIWTPWGRRKPFILVGFVISGIALIITPFAVGLWMLIVMIVILYIGSDVGYQGPFAPLLYEVVPPPQRGRASVIKRYSTDLMKLVISVSLLSQWENIYRFAANSGGPALTTTPLPPIEGLGKAPPPPGTLYQFGRPSWLPGWFHLDLTGAHVLYFVFAAIVLGTAIAIAYGIRETKPEQSLPRERFNPVTFLIGLARDRQMVMVALLLFCGSTLTVSLGGYLTTVMLKEQFHFTSKSFAYIQWWNTVIVTAAVMPIALFICDRIDRRLLYRWGLFLGTLHHLAMWVMIKWVGIPSIKLWIIMVASGLLVDTVAGLALEPLVFDMVPREKMGTINSGFLFISKILGMIIAPLIGYVIWFVSYARNDWSTTDVKWDYSVGFLVYFALGIIGCASYFFYIEPHWRSGNLTDLSGGHQPKADPDPVNAGKS